MLITPVGLENMRFHQHPRGNSPCILVVLFSMASVILLSCTKNNKHLTITQLETWGFASTEFFRKQNCFQHVTGSDWYPCCWSCWLTLTCCICWGTAWVMMNCDFWSSVVEVPLLCCNTCCIIIACWGTAVCCCTCWNGCTWTHLAPRPASWKCLRFLVTFLPVFSKKNLETFLQYPPLYQEIQLRRLG